MSSLAILMMVLICGFVWGGFFVLLTRAIRSEGRKQAGGAKAQDEAD